MAGIKNATMIKYSSVRKALAAVSDETHKTHEQFMKKIAEEFNGRKIPTPGQEKGSFLRPTR